MLLQPSTITCCHWFDRNCVSIWTTENLQSLQSGVYREFQDDWQYQTLHWNQSAQSEPTTHWPILFTVHGSQKSAEQVPDTRRSNTFDSTGGLVIGLKLSKEECGPFGIVVTFSCLQQAGNIHIRRNLRNTTQRPHYKPGHQRLSSKRVKTYPISQCHHEGPSITRDS